MHFVIVGGRDPSDDDTWSGTPKNLAASLQRGGHRVTTIGPLPPIETLWPRMKAQCYRRILGQDYVTIRDPAAVRARAPQANKMLREHADVDAVIALHPADAAYLQSPAPLIFVHDATWHQLLDFYPRYARRRLAKETINGGHELDRLAIGNCDTAIYSSRWSAQSAVFDCGLSADKATVHPFGANLASAHGDGELEQAISLRGRGPCRLLFVGIDWFRKGGDIAVAIARQLRDRGVAVELQLVGCDAPVENDDVVRKVGFLSKKDPAQAAHLARLFLQADFLLLPSRADCTPIVLSEAAANGVPVVATQVGGVGELVQSGTWGMTFRPGAPPSDFAGWIQQTFVSRGAYEKMASAARQDYDKRLNWDSFCRELTAIIEAMPPATARRAKPRNAIEPAGGVAAVAL
jgi:glycosyltransferase involved in cell wall biosynthesis